MIYLHLINEKGAETDQFFALAVSIQKDGNSDTHVAISQNLDADVFQAYALILSAAMSSVYWCGGRKICAARDFWIVIMCLGLSLHPFKGMGVEMLGMWMPVVDT